MTLKKLKETAKETRRLPAKSIPEAGVRGGSAEGFVGRPAGLQPRPPKFDQRDLDQFIAES
jgi:hypothetical protein